MDIAMHQSKGAVTLNDIAKRQEISVKYLWQVINPLKTAVLVKTLLENCGMEPYLKTTGGKGLHVVSGPPDSGAPSLQKDESVEETPGKGHARHRTPRWG